MRLNDGERHSYLASGQALFLPLRGNLWDLRRATKKQFAAQAELHSYTVMQVIEFYPKMIDLMMSDEQGALRELSAHEAEMSGKKGGAFCCVAFWDAQNEEGILFHRQGRELLTAYLPPLTMADVIREQTISCCLVLFKRAVAKRRWDSNVPRSFNPLGEAQFERSSRIHQTVVGMTASPQKLLRLSFASTPLMWGKPNHSV